MRPSVRRAEVEVLEAVALAGGGLAILMAALVLSQGPGRATNRVLAALLFFEGVAHVGGSHAVVTTAHEAALDAIHALSVLAATGCYLLFLGTIASPLAAPFRSRAGQAGVLVLTSLAVVLAFSRLPQRSSADDLWRGVSYLVFAAVAVYGLIVALSAVRRARARSAERERAVAYAWAFGARDACYFFGLVFPWTLLGLPDLETHFIEAAPILFVPMLAYGILRTQLFDIDVRMKVGLRRGTVLGAFAGVFLVAAQVAQEFLSDAYGWLAGGATAALLLLAISPLQRAAHRVADAAFPNVSGSPEYLSYRKLQVYRATFEELSQEGGVTPKERATLDRLRRELGVREEDAHAVEREVSGAVPA